MALKPCLSVANGNNMQLRVAVLAAGAGSRFDGIKQLHPVNGVPMALHSYTLFRGILGDCVQLVLGAHQQTIRANLPEHVNYKVVADWQSGLGHTIASVVSSLPGDCSHLMLALADQVAVTEQDILALLSASKGQPGNIIASAYAGGLGVPAIFPRDMFGQLQQLKGDRGAKSVIMANSMQLCRVEIANAAIDIDTRQQAREWQQKENCHR